jgi:DHA3 family macrolide efflux protein-like MFS transporter
VTERFGGDAVDFATISAAVCAGILVGGLILAVWGGTKRRIVTAMVGLLVSGISVVAMGLCPPGGFVFATGAIFVAGLVISMANGSFSAIMQTVIPKTMQGRVFALTGSAAMSAAPLGLIVGAPISEAFGVHSMYVVSGVAMIALCAFALTMPSVLRFEELGKTAEPPSSVGSPAPSSPEDH